jgi:hypothetical protein
MDIFSRGMEDLLHGNEYMFQVKKFQNGGPSSDPLLLSHNTRKAILFL